MSGRNVVDFLCQVASRPQVLASLKIKSKAEVIEAATDFGLPFTEPEFDSVVWTLEVRLAGRRGEKFDAHFPLWATMWGQYYLEYLVTDMMASLGEADFGAVTDGDAAKR